MYVWLYNEHPPYAAANITMSIVIKGSKTVLSNSVISKQCTAYNETKVKSRTKYSISVAGRSTAFIRNRRELGTR